MSPKPRFRTTVTACLGQFLASTGRANLVFDDRANLIRDLGLSSDEGVDFVLDLCDTFSFEFPADFNPFVHDDGRRGRSLIEMIRAVENFVSAAEVAI